MEKQIQWGIIGVGDVCERKSGPAFQKVPGSDLLAVMRRNGEKARDFADRHDVPKWYDDGQALINDPGINAIYIATPPDSHAHYTRLAAVAGKPVYVEKPMARTYAECLEMIQVCEKHQVPLFRIADIVCASVPIGLFFGRLANFVNGELYGRFTNVWWGIVFPDGSGMPRHPSQLYEAALEGVILFLLLAVLVRIPSVRNRPGTVAGAFLMGYGTFRFMVEFFREPDEQIGYIANLITMGQILCIPMILLGAFLVFRAARQVPKISAAQTHDSA